MKILIVGGGIGGLALAGFLEKKGISVTLIEQAPEFKHIGFGMSLLPNGRRILRELGIDEEVGRDGYAAPWAELADLNGRVLGQKINMHALNKYGEPPIAIERAALHGALVKNLQKTDLHLNTTLKKIKNEKEKVEVEFSDGKTLTFDLLVAADGIRSKIREQFFGDKEVTFYGWSIRFFWMPAGVPVPKGPICISKEKTTLALYPLKEKGFVGIYEYNPQRIDHPPMAIDDFLPYLEKHGWSEKDIRAVSKEAREGHQYYDHLRHVDLGHWSKKRVVLLGDARHGLSPLSGLSGSMALEDAFVLADELAKSDDAHIDLALANYEKRRNPHVREVINYSKFLEKLFFIDSSLKRKIRDGVVRLLPKLPKDIVMKKLEKILNAPF